MRTVDHLFLGKYLAYRYLDTDYMICKKAFVFGNILPDINFFTYFRGCLKKGEIKGHNFENIENVIKKLIKKIENKNKKYTVLDFLRLGKLMHYMADAFTYPHNTEFKGDLTAHVDYEEKLHKEFMKYADNIPSLPYIFNIEGNCLNENFLNLHNSFKNNIDDFQWNIKHILMISKITMNKLCVTEREKVFKNFQINDEVMA
ncbi:MAG: zinc dependent phospholipase C family protein, partial [Lachnospirales bacterium]